MASTMSLRHSIMRTAVALVLAVVMVMSAGVARGGAFENVAPAAAAFRGGHAVPARPTGDILVEAEEMKPAGEGGWKAINWRENYYAATFAITFLSRKACLSAPEQLEKPCVATIDVDVPAAGKYLALARYEAAYRFETQFRIKIEQGGKVVLDRLYGARNNTKIWAFASLSKTLNTEVGWYWGAVENTVWEGHDTSVDLQPGKATITLIADKQPEPGAKRNVDAILLTTQRENIEKRLKTEGGYLPLDGLLTQAGDVMLKIENKGPTGITVNIGPGGEHSPYWVHVREWKPVQLTLESGKASEWTDVGGLLDTLNDGPFNVGVAPGTKETKADWDAPLNYRATFGIKKADGTIEKIAEFDSNRMTLALAYDANTRYTKRIRRIESVLNDLLTVLKDTPVRGKKPERMIVYCYSFSPRMPDPASGNKLWPEDEKYNANIKEFLDSIGVTKNDPTGRTKAGRAAGYIDVRGTPTANLEAELNKYKKDGTADQIRTVSLGDEIGLSAPGADAHEGYRNWAKARGAKPDDLSQGAGDDWSKVMYSPDPKMKDSDPRAYYYSQLYTQQFGIMALKQRTDIIKAALPNADAGANFSPHGSTPYLGEAHQWITLFRQGGMTQPWGEDYTWQIPVGTQQMTFLLLDVFRAGNRYHPARDIHWYVMPHWPGNTTNSWRRLFYGALGHGMTIANLFEFRPVQVAYTENHVSLPEMFLEVRKTLYELGTFEDIVQDGRPRWGNVALWYSDAGDIWHNHREPFGAAKRSLYIAAAHQQVQIDVVDEEDALKGTLKDYKAIYLADLNVSKRASQALTEWVKNGGKLFASAGAGMYDEYNQLNTTMKILYGVKQNSLVTDHKIKINLEKQDLPFAEQVDTVRWIAGGVTSNIPAYGAISKVEVIDKSAEIQGTFKDGTPAVTMRREGKGVAVYAAFQPSLSYFKPAIPKRPVDRGSTDDAMAHFIPTAFDENAARLVGVVTSDVERPVVCSNNLVDAKVIQAKSGTAVILSNWSGKAIKGLKVTVDLTVPTNATLATGGNLTQAKDGAKAVYTLDLDVADAIILR